MGHLRKWRTLASEFVINHRWCRVRRDTVQLPNGTVIDDFFVNVRPDIALVVPITPDGKVVLVQQYRQGVDQILLELPAGSFDPTQETAIAAAHRELREETGYRSSHWTHLATLYDNPVKDTNRIHLFIAQDASRQDDQTLDSTEEIEVVLLPWQKLGDRITQGDICVSGSVAAIFLAGQFLAAQSTKSSPEL